MDGRSQADLDSGEDSHVSRAEYRLTLKAAGIVCLDLFLLTRCPQGGTNARRYTTIERELGSNHGHCLSDACAQIVTRASITLDVCLAFGLRIMHVDIDVDIDGVEANADSLPMAQHW